MKKAILLLSILLITTCYSNAQYATTFVARPESSKPGFSSFLQGIRTWEFGEVIYNGVDQSSAKGGDFGYAYVIKEIIMWMEATLPDAEHGIDFNNKSTTHLWVNVTWNTSYHLNRSYNYIWTISCEIEFEDAGIGYSYTFNLPNVSVRGNDFNDHSLYGSMRKNITDRVHMHNSWNELETKRITTGITERNIKETINSPLEGIYEDVISSDGGKKNKYKLGLKVIEGKMYLIYLSGCNLWDDWTEGDLKATLNPTGSPHIYRGTWINRDKTVSTAYYTFSSGGMEVVVDGEKSVYLKLYPTVTSEQYEQATDWSGTGFALKNGYVVTNYHVVEDAKTINISGINGDFGGSYTASVVATDKENDLAIIKVNDSRFNGFGTLPYAIDMNQAEVGDDVFVLGYPLTQTMGDEIKLTNGIISSRTGFQGDVSLYQMSAPIQPGNSGGPMFNSKGNVVGIVSAHHKGTENVGYAIKTSYLKNLAESSSLSNIFPTNNTISTLPLSGQVKKLKRFVYLIKCSSQGNSSTSYNSGNTSSSSEKTINYPSVSTNVAKDLTVTRITLTNSYTAVEIRFKFTNYAWCNIASDTYISANGNELRLVRTEGINISPQVTYYNYRDITFTLYFPPIPSTTTQIDLIEPGTSSWKIYGIKLQ